MTDLTRSSRTSSADPTSSLTGDEPFVGRPSLPEHLNPEELEDELVHVYAALEVSSAGTFSWNERDFTFTWSPGCYRLHGFDPRHYPIKYEDFFSRIPNDVRDSLEAKVIASRDDRTVFDTIYPVNWPNGETHWIHARGVWDYDDKGKPVRLFGIGLDADERVAAEQSVAVGEVKLKEAQEASELGSWELNVITDTFKLSQTCAEVHGVEVLEMPMREAFALIPKEDQKRVSNAFLSAHHADGVFDVEHRINHQSSGELRWVHSKGHGVFDEEGKLLCIVGTNRDITDRRRAELAFVDTARTFRTLTQASPGLVFRTDEQGQATFFNVDRWAHFSGLGRDAWRGQGWFAAFHPDCRDQARDEWQATISARAEFHGEYRWVHVDGSDRWIYFHALPVSSDSGFGGYVGTGTDITALKTSESQQATLQAALAESQKMEAVGTLASGVAHDFNNMLTAVRGFVELARRKGTPAAQVDSYLEQAEQAIDQAKDVTKGLLTFARGGTGQREPICFNQLVEGNVHLLRQLLSAKIDLETSIPKEALWVYGDETDLKQLLTNLIVNSRDAMPSGGLLRVNLTKEGDAHLALEVVDTGIGMSADVSSRIFEPFFSTKEQGQGTGLGLAVAHGTVVSHGGSVYVDSQLGQGTKIKVVLPICEPKVDEISTQARFKGANQPCRILFVEDNDLVRESAMLRIESDGYEVAGFRSGEEGIASMQGDTAYDVAVLDVDLPGIDGVDTASCLREIKPGLPVIFVTGNTQNESLNKARSNDPVISKPIEFETLLQVVDGVNARVAAG